MNFPNLNSGSGAQSANLGAALVADNGNQVGLLNSTNDYQQSTEVDITIARAADGTLGEITIIKGRGDVRTLVTINGVKVTFTGDWTAEELNDYFGSVPMLINGIRVQTNNTANFSGYLTVGNRMPNKTTRPRKIKMDKYRVNNAGGIGDVLEIKDANGVHTVTPGWFLKLSDLALSSWVTITLNIVGVGQAAATQEVKY